MKDLTLKILVGVLALMLLASLTLSERFFVLSDHSMVVPISTVKTGPEIDGLMREIDYYGVHLPRTPSKLEAVLIAGRVANGGPRYEDRTTRSAPAFGYSVRELAFLGMPFAVYSENGPVLFVRDNWETTYIPLNDKGMEVLARANGRDVTKDRIYPYWTHLWGWLFVLGIAVCVWLWLRRAARIREEQGLI